MAAEIIKGKPIADEILDDIRVDVDRLKGADRPVHLVAVQIGANPASRLYTTMQERACQRVGIRYTLDILWAGISQSELAGRIADLGEDGSVTGLILQMPVPPQVDARRTLAAIPPRKDAEAMHPQNLGRLIHGEWNVAPCTPSAVVEILSEHVPDLAGKEVVIVGHSDIFGKPLANMLLASRDAAPTVTVCHVATRDLAFHTRRADVLIVAAGVSQAKWLAYSRKRAGDASTPPDLSPLVSGDMIKPQATVIDVAINCIPAGFDQEGAPLLDENGKARMITVGDVDFEAAKEIARAVTPVPGGVGPLTVAMLLRNTLACAER